MIKAGHILCPSYRCKPGSYMLGIRNNDGTTSILPQPLSIDMQFLENAEKLDRPVEQYFRFTNRCIREGCLQWNGTGCIVADRVVEKIDDIPDGIQIPQCGIRTQCRWFIQHGYNSCKMCPYILSEVTKEEVLLMMVKEDETARAGRTAFLSNEI